MKTIVIEIQNLKAYKLLQALEDLKLIRIIKASTKPSLPKKDRNYGGALPANIADDLQNYVSESRNEWQNRNT